MGPMVQYAMGAFIQSLEQNRGIEQYLQSLGTKCHIYVGTGLGELTIAYEEALRFESAFHRWNEFWAAPERCSPLRAHKSGEHVDSNAPRDPVTLTVGSEEWIEAKHEWERHWAARSDGLTDYLNEARSIQGEPVPPSSNSAKLSKTAVKDGTIIVPAVL